MNFIVKPIKTTNTSICTMSDELISTIVTSYYLPLLSLPRAAVTLAQVAQTGIQARFVRWVSPPPTRVEGAINGLLLA
ncbi:hypothetical protein [Coxiella endosymbiont of Ornithodoros amblus]|uniref:hypothetical protein n=1 Tax=Coxiella endosymbiont of Ornithodoros amblus TaxID=1656166 RepID=UPI00244DCBF8|nr:hypothetical protein [Coxiella endosymbiont of Ornithodoros amblus]